MAVGKVASYPDYNATKNIPVLFAGQTLERFYAYSTVVNISNTDYVGEVKEMGDTVYIRTVPDITIKQYKKGQKLELEYPESPYEEFTINKAKYYNFALDDIDIKQFDLNMMSKYADNAAQRIKIIQDTEVFSSIYADADTYNTGTTAGKISQNINLGTTGAPLTLGKEDGSGIVGILTLIVNMGVVLDEQNIPETDRWLVIPPKVAGLIKNSDLGAVYFSGDDKSLLRSGNIGQKIDRFNIFLSNLLPTVTDGADKCTYLYFGHKSALTFVGQLTKTEIYRPQDTFAQAMKGLFVYDFKVLQPTAMGVAYVKR